VAAAVNSRPGLRKLRAQATRQRMVTAAYTLFCSRGYQATTMNDIAAQAQVAVQTLYFTFQSKSALLQEAFEQAVLGPDPIPPHLQPWFERMRRTPQAHDAIRHAVAGSTAIFERVAPLITAVRAVATDADAAAVYERQEQLRRRGYSDIVDVFAQKTPLRPDLDPRAATDILLVLLSPETYHAFVTGHGWSTRRYKTWATDAIYQQLFTQVPV